MMMSEGGVDQHPDGLLGNEYAEADDPGGDPAGNGRQPGEVRFTYSFGRTLETPWGLCSAYRNGRD